MILGKIEQDLKKAMLAGSKNEVSTLRGVKSALQYAQVGKPALEEAQIIAVLQKEVKKRQEAADLYAQAGNEASQQKELAEKALIEGYLPAQLSEAELNKIIDEVIAKMGVAETENMGQIIGAVKAKTSGSAEGAVIARLVKERL